MELHDFRDFTVCPACAGLAGCPPGREAYPQVCRCDRREQERWPDHDFNEYADLCWCCQVELIPSGSKWSSFYCGDCRQRIRAYNEAAGRLVFLMGRHSIMNGVGLRGSDAARPEAVRAFGEAMRGFSFGMVRFDDAMDRWRPMRLEAVRRAIGQEVAGEGGLRPLLLTPYLEAAAGRAGEAGFGKRAAFDALCEFLGYPLLPEVA